MVTTEVLVTGNIWGPREIKDRRSQSPGTSSYKLLLTSSIYESLGEQHYIESISGYSDHFALIKLVSNIKVI